MPDSGEIYLITNTKNGKVYVGQAISERSTGYETTKQFGASGRFEEHIRNAMAGKKGCTFLYNAIRKYGSDSFKIYILLICNTEFLDSYEERFIHLYNSTNPKRGYNILPCASGTTSERQKQLWQDPKFREKRSKTFSSPEYKEKIGAIRTEMYKDRDYRQDQSQKHRKCDDVLPPNIYYAKDKGNITGYRINITYNAKKYTKCFTSNKQSMEQKLELAIQWIENKRQELQI